MLKPGQLRKAIATAVGGVYLWAGIVLASPESGVTHAEWYGLGGVAVTVLAVFGLANDPATLVDESEADLDPYPEGPVTKDGEPEA